MRIDNRTPSLNVSAGTQAKRSAIGPSPAGPLMSPKGRPYNSHVKTNAANDALISQLRSKLAECKPPTGEGSSAATNSGNTLKQKLKIEFTKLLSFNSQLKEDKSSKLIAEYLENGGDPVLECEIIAKNLTNSPEVANGSAIDNENDIYVNTAADIILFLNRCDKEKVLQSASLKEIKEIKASLQKNLEPIFKQEIVEVKGELKVMLKKLKNIQSQFKIIQQNDLDGKTRLENEQNALALAHNQLTGRKEYQTLRAKFDRVFDHIEHSTGKVLLADQKAIEDKIAKLRNVKRGSFSPKVGSRLIASMDHMSNILGVHFYKPGTAVFLSNDRGETIVQKTGDTEFDRHTNTTTWYTPIVYPVTNNGDGTITVYQDEAPHEAPPKTYPANQMPHLLAYLRDRFDEKEQEAVILPTLEELNEIFGPAK